MRVRTTAVAVALACGSLVPTGSGAQAATTWIKCDVTGTVELSPGMTWGLSEGAGSYQWNQILIVCMGALTGIGTGSSSSGEYGSINCGGVDVPGAGSFCGNYHLGAGYLIGGTCSGTIGGDEGALANAANGDWSWIQGSHVAAGITCTFGAMTEGVGVINAIAVPSADDSCRTNPPPDWVCELYVEGVFVIYQP